MNKFYHLRRISYQTLQGLALLLLTSVAYGTSSNLITTVDCQAAFYKEAYQDASVIQGGVTFHNFSEGDYTSVDWDFGDGTSSNEIGSTISHFYAESGTYEVTLTIWDDSYSCLSSATKSISVISSSNACLLSDCVYPGDADKNGKADLFDLMTLGMGFGLTGPARQNPEPTEWVGQAALDWAESTADGTNYKHFDSDGNGIIDYQDIMPILHHYTPMEDGLNHTSNIGPKVSLDFEFDTIHVDDDTESILTISAGLIVGTVDQPMEDVYGLALHFDYDAALTEVTEGVVVNYNDNCFFGDQDEVIAFGKEIRDSEQADLAITRMNGQNTSGYGRVATVQFIIIIDIIGDRTERVVPFDVPITGIKVIDKDGNIVPVNIDSKSAEVVFIKENSTTKVKENPLNNKVSVFPNPVTDVINIELTDLNGEYITIYNSLGQLVATHNFDQTRTSISAKDLSRGMYLLNIQTDKGLVNKRIVVE